MGGEDLPELLRDYFKELDEHIVGRIRDGKVGDSCFAAVMFICAAIDSLGCLIAPSKVRHKPGPRFRYVVKEFFPSGYHQRQKRLWALRNDLMHNALNVACFLAATQEADVPRKHLAFVPDTPYLFVDTSVFHRDLCAAIEGVQSFLQNASEAKMALNRLERVYTDAWEAPVTLPPLVRFRQR